ncbi:MAG: diguanylate cyclase [Lachnospiraceae bacterium]|nr:diguanylate cyclase [Lachnospiraceae bacterium]
MKITLIALESVSLAVLLMLLYGSIFEVNRKLIKNRAYTMAVVSSIIAVITDITAWGLNGIPRYSAISFVADLLAFLMGYMMTFFFCIYLIQNIREKRPVPKMHVKCLSMALILSMIFVIAGAFMRRVFYIEDGFYRPGDWYVYTQIFNFLVMIYCLILITANARMLGVHDTVALLSYFIFPAITTFLHIIWPDISLTYVAIMFSELTIYIMLQAEQEADFRVREKALTEASRTDTLTKLQNRRAYDEKKEAIKNLPQVGAIFCDVNGLKYTNDNFGHKAGDELINGFAAILRDHFRYDDIFRISGDEFVILLGGTGEDLYKRRVDDLAKILSSQDIPVAAMGASYGKGEDVLKIINEAEERMYAEKEAFHKKYPDYKGR